MKHHITALFLTGVLLLSCTACSGKSADKSEVQITLDDSGVICTNPKAVHTNGKIIYYKDGTDASYGEGVENEKHSAEEAAAHTVVTITKPGTYRLTGKLSRGQIFVDLGKNANRNPNAVVTLILDNADITCTVAPAIFFYRVFECDTKWTAYDRGKTADYQSSPNADTSAAGANVILAAGSENNITGSHVARIYKEGTTDKLHKYDGAFYSRMSMNICGDNGDDSGVLNITADNEGLNSEMHLTVNGGTVHINSQDDGINTNEDNVSVTTINGGFLTVTAGRGAEGDGIDSNGYLTVNGGTVITVSNPRTPDGGIDADRAITVNGGTLYAFGTRNDAADSSGSAQPYMELSFASTLTKGSVVKVTDEDGTVLWEATIPQNCQSITLTTPALQLNTVYRVYVNDTLQCYNGNSFGMMGGFGGGMGGFGGMGGQPPEGFDPGQSPEGGQRPEGMNPPEDWESKTPPSGSYPGTPPEGGQRPGGSNPPGDMGGGRNPGGNRGEPGQMGGSADGETDFILTETVKSFSGICDSAQSGKTAVTFHIVSQTGIFSLSQITCSDETLPLDQIQITVTDDPSEDYAESCLLSDGMDAVNGLLPEDGGNYILTVAVVSGNSTHTGATQIRFTVPQSTQE